MPPADLRTFFRLIAAWWFTFALAACDRGGEALPDGSGADSEGLRIVSLSPALTRIAVDLGLADRVVGRTQFCTAVDASVPVVGDHFAQNLEMLVRLRPTHVLIQPPRNEVPSNLRALADEHGWTLLHWRIDTIEDVRAIVGELPARLFSREGPARDEIERRAAALLRKIDDALTPGPSPSGRGEQGVRVLLVYSTDPSISVFGGETYLDEIIRAFGWANAAAHLRGWGQISLEDAVRLDPDAIIVIAEREQAVSEALGPLASLPLRAIDQGRVALLIHPEALLPSTSVIEIAAELRAILDSFAEEES